MVFEEDTIIRYPLKSVSAVAFRHLLLLQANKMFMSKKITANIYGLLLAVKFRAFSG